jgi:5-hydroxyisourate hydrolase
MTVSTHILDAIAGGPAAGVTVHLEAQAGDEWRPVATVVTDADGRAGGVESATAAVHRLTFDTGAYFADRGTATFYPQVVVVFDITDAAANYHVPLLLSPYAYSTYRGS